jgi:hypothetical protein
MTVSSPLRPLGSIVFESNIFKFSLVTFDHLKYVGYIVVLFFFVSLRAQTAVPELSSFAEFEVGSDEACIDFSEFYERADTFSASADSVNNWRVLSDELLGLLEICLNSSQFFSLLGAAQLNSLDNARAIESLERALLLRPDNGAASIDYAQALYNEGQLFPALEINESLINRDDTPSQLVDGLVARQARWRAAKSDHSVRLDLVGGYDNNLNGAPDASQITLTLSGEPVLLSLDQDFQSTSGPYANLALASRFRDRSAELQHSWVNEARGRLSGDTRSDLLQFESRYSVLRPKRDQNWEASVGLTHLLFGGSSFFSAAQGVLRYQHNGAARCNPNVQLAAQLQRFQQQSQLDALESKAGAGLLCKFGDDMSAQATRLGLEFGVLDNHASRAGRPGGDRGGWQALGFWQTALWGGTVQAQVTRTILKDDRSYSPILVSGANRWVRRDQVVLQHRRPFRVGQTAAALIVNFSHQNQRSNIQLFGTRDTNFEVGLSFAF